MDEHRCRADSPKYTGCFELFQKDLMLGNTVYSTVGWMPKGSMLLSNEQLWAMGNNSFCNLQEMVCSGETIQGAEDGLVISPELSLYYFKIPKMYCC